MNRTGPVTLYSVYDHFRTEMPVLAFVRAERRANTYRLLDADRAFGHQAVVPIGTYAESIEDAITRYQQEQLRRIDAYQRDIAQSRTRIEWSRKLAECLVDEAALSVGAAGDPEPDPPEHAPAG